MTLNWSILDPPLPHMSFKIGQKSIQKNCLNIVHNFGKVSRDTPANPLPPLVIIGKTIPYPSAPQSVTYNLNDPLVLESAKF